MTDREPYLALREFKVWFSRHRSFFESLRRSDPGYVRAVDGLNFTIGKGEIYCLVGESGCGKTTTGKGILRLVEPTSGDVFLNPTSEELAQYEKAKAGGKKADLEELRKRRSLTYTETVQRSVQDWVLGVLFGAGGVVLAALLGFGIILGLRSAGAGSAQSFAYLILGLPLAFLGTIPWVKVSRHVPHLLALAAVPAAIVTQVLALYAAHAAADQPSDLGAVLGAYGAFLQENTLFVALAQFGLAALGTWICSGVFGSFWARRRGVETDRLRKLRTRLQIIFQDPYESLNPRHTVYSIVAEPLLVNRITRSRAETEARVEQALQDSGLRPPKEYLLRYPHELSGGQRQRVGIAGALVLEPEFLVADEPVSMLDVSIRTEIIELLLELRQKRSLTYLFITHDLSLAYVLADRIGVMYLGKIVEEGPTEQLISNPRHPYTKALISVVPMPDPDRKRERIILKGERPDPSDIPTGCRFHPRCPAAFERCGWTSDELLDSMRQSAKGEESKYIKGAAAQGPGTIIWPSVADGFETWLRGLMASRSEDDRALKAIQSIERTGPGAKVVLHAFEEPGLKAVAPNVLVACHLFG
jgi:oligopeptide/dipeptide ABC transporter ATP-binding protein